MARTAARLAGVILALALVVPTSIGVAHAKTPAGPRTIVQATETIDAHPGYQPQSTCDPTPKPGATALLRLLIKTWGGSSSGISRSCTSGRVSEHKEGRALDWHMSVKNKSQRNRVSDALKWLTSNNGEVALRLGVQYILWNQRIWSVYYPELGWRKMEDRGGATANHKDHVHISLTWDGAMKQTSWWTGKPVTVPLNGPCGKSGNPKCKASISRADTAWKNTGVTVPLPMVPAPGPVPRIAGSPQVGRTLVAVPGTWVPEGASIAFQWLNEKKKPIKGATSDTFVPTRTYVGELLFLKVTVTRTDGKKVSKISPETTKVAKANFTKAPRPTITGVPTEGQLLTADAGSWRPIARLSYQWLRNGKAIKGATKAAYKVTAKDKGKKISVKVTGRRGGYNTKTVTSAALKAS